MEFALFVTIIVLSVLLGIFGARARGRRWIIASLFVILVLVANIVQCLRYFMRDPQTWTTTFGSGLVMGFIPLLIVTALPALIGCGITRCVARLKVNNSSLKDA